MHILLERSRSGSPEEHFHAFQRQTFQDIQNDSKFTREAGESVQISAQLCWK